MGPDAVEGAPEQLSGVAVVIIIAVGVQTFIMLFIFAKRQVSSSLVCFSFGQN